MPTVLKQIKVTLLDPESSEIERAAKRKDISVSNEVRSRLGYPKLEKGPKGPHKKKK